jgi:hypothetical protein
MGTGSGITSIVVIPTVVGTSRFNAVFRSTTSDPNPNNNRGRVVATVIP